VRIRRDVIINHPAVFRSPYLGVLYVGVGAGLEMMVVISLAIYLVGGAFDTTWAMRRLTWPSGTIVMKRGNEQNWVAFPKPSGS
jgi:hypothetical protein